MSTHGSLSTNGIRSGPWNGVNRSLHNSNTRPTKCIIKALPLFNSPESEVLLKQVAIDAAWARLVHPLSVIFNVGKIASDHEFCEIMVQTLGSAGSYIPRYSKTKDLMVEVLFSNPETRRKATTTGLDVKGSRIVAFPGFSSGDNIIKVDLCNIPACDANIELREPLKAAMESYGKVIDIRAYVDHYDQFRGKATVFLDISANAYPKPLHSQIRLGGCFNATISARSKIFKGINSI
ncbi:hypothetical protein PHYBLDRAFT_164760 [Phycomyces blakesleeanus NRRL 1555(-)]|uniref:Uncharacterized protein n=1 Tax=Phycomyces blakesleeanus (strain ATCC 8743b / DSM 1359 / FGSC 10004 / NBRC 33097 / NRRL 1555) TaxID=763407 RepID=A0A167PGM0_PHYB8|nr:hypothetical protein PHYBLDRAFT_164760 [Phycomyces blakesleeanus NRRL 1555(-)]OAD77876.1 hypothetical protein PHYBLDRAFT_164760 [Phycomyces blakesleeanus NRRL 1555(-)]|eukprot:XP_018295916.1 hypothetical protein PHYBLDRAFT_164760 [Phycomyces blakesleeanus NRRL 1555(-)]